MASRSFLCCVLLRLVAGDQPLVRMQQNSSACPSSPLCFASSGMPRWLRLLLFVVKACLPLVGGVIAVVRGGGIPAFTWGTGIVAGVLALVEQGGSVRNKRTLDTQALPAVIPELMALWFTITTLWSVKGIINRAAEAGHELSQVFDHRGELVVCFGSAVDDAANRPKRGQCKP